jgi:hypothetical protein
MKGITTIAAIPSGAGCLSALPAEVGEAKPEGVQGVKFPEGTTFTFFDEAQAAFHPLPAIDADMLDTSKGN